jgi:hypothetical protein
MPMPLIPDIAVFQRKLATLPVVTYQAGETVLSAASTTGRLLILKEGAVAVVKEGVEIARVTEPGAVFGELSGWISRTPRTYMRWKPRSFTSPMRHHTQDRPDRAPLRCNGPGAASRQRQSGPPRAEAAGPGRRAAQRNWKNRREDRRTAGRQRCQSCVCRLSL